MGYRDDVDTLYQRALILQKELDAAQQRLAERERELESLRGGTFEALDTSPGIRTLRELPPAETLLSRLVNAISNPVDEGLDEGLRPSNLDEGLRPSNLNNVYAGTDPRFAGPHVPPQDPMELIQPQLQHRAAVLLAAREHLDRLPDRLLMIVGAIIEDLSERPRAELVTRLQAISEEITTNYRRRTWSY